MRKPLDKILKICYNKYVIKRDYKIKILKDVFFMTEKKLTKKDKFFMLLELDEVQENPILKDFCNSEIELLNRKNSSRKVNKNSEENDFLKAEMMKAFTKEPDRLFTATEIWKTLPNWSDYSNQRISALLKQLKDEGKITKIENKKKSLFQLN